MAEELDDCEFWLPPQFLTDDDFLMEFKQTENENEGNKKGFVNGLGGFGNNSGLSSPVESVVCSTETESDEDEYLTGLTRKMAQSTLNENCYGYEASKKWGLSGSPKSPLCKYGSSRSSFRGGPQVSPAPGLNQNEGAWDLLCSAAGEVSRMKMAEESTVFYPSRNGPVVPPSKPGPISVPPVNTGPNFGFSSNQPPHLSYQQLQAAWFERLKMQQLMKQQQKINGVYGQGNGGCRDVPGNPAGFSMSAWPTLQQSQQQRQQQPPPPPQVQRGSGMRAVFLGNSGVKRECAGTGVFIPRRAGSTAETRKNKPACSTVLLPERVVHALNLNLDPMDAAQPQLHSRYNPSFTSDFDVAMKYRAQQKQSSMSMSMRPQPMMMTMNQEVRLPQDWTY